MSTTRALRHQVRVAAIGSLAVATASMLAFPAANGAGTTKWVTLSPGIHNTLSTPSIAKFGSGYEAIWVADTGAKFAVQARILNAAGKPVGKVITALGGWAGIQGDPTILADGKQRIIAFGGAKEGTPGPYDSGAEFYLTSSNGKSWTLSSGSLSAADGADRDNGTAVINDGGTIIAGLAENGGVVYHVGASSSNPAPGPDHESSMTGSGTQEPGLAVDAKSHKIWAVWYSDSSGIADGVHAQIISPSLGTLLNAPGSASKTLGSFGAQQDVTAAARVGGGVYTAYGTPKVNSIDVWKLGAKKPFATIKTPNGVGALTLTPAPHGRLWLFWRDRFGWRATRSNRAATRFGPQIFLAPPKNLTLDEHLGATGTAGSLEAVAQYTTPSNQNIMIARQVLPKLIVSASPHSVKRGHSFTVKVTDAGDAVKGATVHFDGHKKKTNKKGRATFKVAHSTSLGKHPVTFTMRGYAAASTKVTVLR
jgi:hypothetical protein